MPYILRKKKYNKAKKNYKKKTLSKKTVNAIKSIARKTLEKTRELKSKVVTVDEYQLTLNSSGVMTTNQTNNYLFNYLSSGTGDSQRVGSQIQPVSLNMKGWLKINGTTTDANYREIKSRVIMGYVDNDSLQQLEASLSTSPVFWSNEAVIPTGDFRDIIRGLNWKFIRPIYDRTFTIAPNYQFNDGSPAQATFYTSKMKDYASINIKHKFGKNAEMRWDSINNDCFQKKNIVCLVFNRLMNDDVIVSTIPVEFNLEGNFNFYDA